MNLVAIIGRLTADPELRYTPNGTAVASARIAVDGAGEYNAQEEKNGTGFLNLVVWGKQAENFAQYCFKGREVAVNGRLQARSYDNNDGQKVYVVEIVADRVQFLREPQGTQEQGQQQQNNNQGNGRNNGQGNNRNNSQGGNNRNQGGNNRGGNGRGK